MTDDDPSQQLCNACGFCCDGTLFAGVPLIGDEHDGFTDGTYTEDGSVLARHPCVFYRGLCSIYSDRPRTCRQYRCKVLKQVEQGEMTRDDALQLIEKYRKVVASLDAELPPSDLGIATRIKQYRSEHADDLERPESRIKHAKVLLNFGAYSLLYDQFVEQKQS